MRNASMLAHAQRLKVDNSVIQYLNLMLTQFGSPLCAYVCCYLCLCAVF